MLAHHSPRRIARGDSFDDGNRTPLQVHFHLHILSTVVAFLALRTSPTYQGCTAMLPESNRSVLIVEDNRDVAETLAALLDLYGFAVRIAYDGEEGLQSACEHPPDMVILDIGLPRMSGLDLARELRATLKSETLLVAMSGYTHKHAECREAGIDHYFIKPVDPETIETLLRDHVETQVTKCTATGS